MPLHGPDRLSLPGKLDFTFDCLLQQRVEKKGTEAVAGMRLKQADCFLRKSIKDHNPTLQIQRALIFQTLPQQTAARFVPPAGQ
jgi:hypothetical protein